MNLTVRVDAGTQIGLGHLSRVQAVIEALNELTPLRVTFVTRSECLRASVLLIPDDVSVVEEGDWIARTLPETEALLADLYQPTKAQLRSLRRADWRLICIDDDTPFRFDCDLLVNPNLNTGFVHNVTPNTRYLYGSEAILLRQQFQSPALRHCNLAAENLLLAFGGSDPTGLSLRVCDWLKNDLPSFVQRVTLLIGAAYPDTDAFHRRLAKERRWQLLHNVADVRTLFESADMGILAAGGMLYEAATTGLPTLTIGVNMAQEREALYMAARNATRYLGRSEQLMPSAVQQGLQLLESRIARQVMAEGAQTLLDGKGSQRVAEAIVSLISAPKEALCAV